MKKYKVIEFDPRTNNIVVKEEFKDFEKAVSELGQYIKDDPKCFYRIEEVEESIMDRVKTYEDACEVLKEEALCKCAEAIVIMDDDDRLTGYIDEKESIHIIALLKLETITAALNEGWKPDWKNKDECKYLVVFNCKSKNLDIFHTYYIKNNINLYFKSHELAEYASKQFAELYKQLLTEKF